MSHGKRADIQGLRCICIFMVLLYHYYPRIFPPGRLGVDMFFVISGFLIALMLSKKREGLVSYFFQFYWRRVKRILPLCYLVFLLSYIAMYILHLDTFIPINKAFGARALCFLANVKMNDEDEYEAQLTGATVLLTHYWSLSTEIQFYLIAPVIVICAFPLNKKTYSFSLLAFLSFIHYITTSEAISFNSPIARLWQFLAGFVAAYDCLQETTHTRLSKAESSEEKELFLPETTEERKLSLFDGPISLPEYNPSKWSHTSANIVSYLPMFIVCSIIFLPSPNFLLDTLFRYIVTLSTMWTLMSHEKNPKFLEHPLAVHIGDISFALYLVHWPILCFVKAYAVDDPCLRTWSIPIAFVLSLVSADVLHKLFEKRQRRPLGVRKFNSLTATFWLIVAQLFNISPAVPDFVTGGIEKTRAVYQQISCNI